MIWLPVAPGGPGGPAGHEHLCGSLPLVCPDSVNDAFLALKLPLRSGRPLESAYPLTAHSHHNAAHKSAV